ncbi:MAG: hypothetical protein ACW99J_20290 [Candidatus Thorarchaeota archaeon]|jgi:hypothetical protein
MTDKEEMFEYLDDLRETAVTNMVGAGPWLQKAFGLEREEARSILREWMDTFEERNSEDA